MLRNGLGTVQSRMAAMVRRIVFVILLAVGFGAGWGFAKSAPVELKTYETRYYVIRTDLNEEQAKEAAVRMTRMAEEYVRRTQGFSGKITQRLPFYLFRHEEDYEAAGGPAGTAGVFTGEKLMAWAGDRPD